MAIQNAAGTGKTQATWLSENPGVAGPNTYTVTADYYETYWLPGDTIATGKRGKRLKFRAGTVLSQAEVDALYKEPTINTVTPGTQTTAGGGTITVTGTNLDEATSVTVTGTAGTGIVITKRDGTALTFVAPAKAAGTYNVVVTTPAGTATKANALVYA